MGVTQLMQLAMQAGTEMNQGMVLLASVCSSKHSLLQTCLAAAACGVINSLLRRPFIINRHALKVYFSWDNTLLHQGQKRPSTVAFSAPVGAYHW
jgi:hypothetical protein